jgi:hypothetical protein
MMGIPEGFSIATLFAEYIDLALPFIAIAATYAFYIVVQKTLSRGM